MRSGDPCHRCVDGYLLTYRTKRCRDPAFSIRYLKCSSCGATGRQWIESRPLRADFTRSGTPSVESDSESVVFASAAAVNHGQ